MPDLFEVWLNGYPITGEDGFSPRRYSESAAKGKATRARKAGIRADVVPAGGAPPQDEETPRSEVPKEPVGAGRPLTTTEAAERLGLSPRRVRALIDAGRLPAVRATSGFLIQAADLGKVADRRPGRPKTGPLT